jgi:hypothetical protein
MDGSGGGGGGGGVGRPKGGSLGRPTGSWWRLRHLEPISSPIGPNGPPVRRGERPGRVVSAQSTDCATPDRGLDRDGVPVAVGEVPVVKGAVGVAKLKDDLRRAPRLDDDADAVGPAAVAEPGLEVRVVGEVELAAVDLAVGGVVPAAGGVVRGSLGGRGAEMGAGDGDLRRGRA